MLFIVYVLRGKNRDRKKKTPLAFLVQSFIFKSVAGEIIVIHAVCTEEKPESLTKDDTVMLLNLSLKQCPHPDLEVMY